MKCILYSQPVDNAIPTVTHDNGVVTRGGEGYDGAGNPCLIIDFPSNIPLNNGCAITWEHPDYVIEPQHCLLIQHTDGKLWLLHDVWKLTPRVTEPEPGPSPVPGESPEEIIQYVYESTHPNLSTHDGCGRFTEDVQTQLSNSLSPLYGHITKTPGQNQYNGHAVDAVMLLMDFGGVTAGVYDIIKDSVSPNAQPAFNWVGPPDSNLWFNPAFESFILRARKK
jgi:hypothetical protein